jgi:hypothetical protein
MLFDHLQEQRTDLSLETNSGEQQAVGIVELCAIELAVRYVGQFLAMGRAEVVALDRRADLGELRPVAGWEKLRVFQDFHDRCPLPAITRNL